MRKLGKTSEGAARANAVSGDGNVVGGWEETPDTFGFRVGSIWEGREQMLLDAIRRVPIGYVSEVMAVNGAGTMAVGYGAGVEAKDAYKWTSDDGVVNIGRYPGYVCYTNYDWETGEPIEICENRETRRDFDLQRRQGHHRRLAPDATSASTTRLSTRAVSAGC